jgi:hypothetical protein
MNSLIPLFMIPTIGLIVVGLVKDSRKAGLIVSIITFIESIRL